LVTVRQCAAIFEVVKPLFDLHSTHCIIAESLLNLPDCFRFGISKLLAHEGPPTTVIRFANLPSLVSPGKNKVGYFLDRVVHVSSYTVANVLTVSNENSNTVLANFIVSSECDRKVLIA
jgi:hypothetical protein